MKINIDRSSTYSVKCEEKIPGCDFIFNVEFVTVLEAMRIRENNTERVRSILEDKMISDVKLTPFTEDVIALLSKKIKSWENVLDAEGKPIPCTEKNIIDLFAFLLSYEKLSYADDDGKPVSIPFMIFEAARKAENFQEGDLKNLKPSSKH